MTADERRKLVEAPLPRVRVLTCSKSWAGCSVQDLDSFYTRRFGSTRSTTNEVEIAEIEEKV